MTWEVVPFCDVPPEPGTADVPLLLVLPAIVGDCAALGLLGGVTEAPGGTALGLLNGALTVGPVVPPDGVDIPEVPPLMPAPPMVEPPVLDPPTLPPADPLPADPLPV